MPIGQQFGFTGQNNILNPLSQTIPQTGFNNTSYANSRYPGLDEDELKKLEQAAKDAGYTGNNLQKGMDIIYQNGINKFNNNKKLEERDGLINKQCFETAQYSGKDKNLREQQDRVTVLAQSIKRAYPKIKADYDDCEVINAYVTGKGFQEEYDNYIRNGDKTILEELQGKSRGSYTEPDKNFWATNAGMFTIIGGGAGLGYAGIKSAIKGVVNKTKSILSNPKTQEWIRTRGEKMYNKAVTVTDKDKFNAQRYGAEQSVLEEYRDELAQAQKDLETAKSAGQTDIIKAKQAEIDELNTLISKHEASLDRGLNQTADIAREKGLVGGSAEELGKKAEAQKIKLWDRQIGKALQDATDAGYTTNVNQLVYDVTDDIIANPGKYVKNPEDYVRIKEAAEKIRNSREGVDYTKTDPIHLNSLKSKVAERNVQLYKSIGADFDAGKNAETVVREAILKEMRNEIYSAGEFASTINGGDGEALKKAFKDRGDFDTISEDMLKEKSLGLDKKGVKSYLERQFKTRVGKKMAEFGKTEEAVQGATEAVKGAEEVVEGAKDITKGTKAAKGTEEVVEDVAKAAKGGKLKGLFKGIVKGGKIFTILEDGSIIPGSPTNIASKNIDTIIEGMVYRKTKKNSDKANKAYDEFMEQYNNIPENERTEADEIAKGILEKAKEKANKKETKYGGTLIQEYRDMLWDGAYKDYFNGDREAFDSVYTDELLKKVIDGDEELPIFI